MTDQEAVEALVQLINAADGDWEVIHIKADRLLCELLKDKYPELVEEYCSLPKWYS